MIGCISGQYWLSLYSLEQVLDLTFQHTFKSVLAPIGYSSVQVLWAAVRCLSKTELTSSALAVSARSGCVKREL